MTFPTVYLPSATPTTPLGFGCSALIGGRTPAQSLALLEAAFDAGVRHFDVARVYGTGDAEAVLGRFARGRRDEITIATKFGIDPLPPSASITAAKSLLRPLMRRSRSLVRLVRRHASLTVTRGRFSFEHAKSSIATSLDQLGTSRVDVLFLHDCSPSDWFQEDLLEALDDLVARQHIGCYGTATTFAATEAILGSGVGRPAVAQFDSDAFSSNREHLAIMLGPSTPITYGCVSRALPLILKRLTGDPALTSEWRNTLQLDVNSTDELGSLLICHAVRANPGGITLFSSGEPNRIRRYAEAVFRGRYEDAQLDEFARLVHSLVKVEDTVPRLLGRDGI